MESHGGVLKKNSSWSTWADPYLLYDSLLQHLRHHLDVNGPRHHAGRVPPEVSVSVGKDAVDLLHLKRRGFEERTRGDSDGGLQPHNIFANFGSNIY